MPTLKTKKEKQRSWVLHTALPNKTYATSECECKNQTNSL